MPKIISRRGREPQVDIELDLPEPTGQTIIVVDAGEEDGLPTFDYYVEEWIIAPPDAQPEMTYPSDQPVIQWLSSSILTP